MEKCYHIMLEIVVLVWVGEGKEGKVCLNLIGIALNLLISLGRGGLLMASETTLLYLFFRSYWILDGTCELSLLQILVPDLRYKKLGVSMKSTSHSPLDPKASPDVTLHSFRTSLIPFKCFFKFLKDFNGTLLMILLLPWTVSYLPLNFQVC